MGYQKREREKWMAMLYISARFRFIRFRLFFSTGHMILRMIDWFLFRGRSHDGPIRFTQGKEEE